MSRFDPRYQVKQYVARVEGERAAFRVFETGDARVWLFSQVDENDCDTGLQMPVLKRDVRPDVAYALRRGVGVRRVLASPA